MSLRISGHEDECLDHGTAYLRYAAELWALADERRGESIERWIENEWEADPDDAASRIYNVASLRYLAGLLDGFEEGLRTVVPGSDWVLTDELWARLTPRQRLLLDTDDGPRGKRYSLAGRVYDVSQLEALVRRAIELDRAIVAPV